MLNKKNYSMKISNFKIFLKAMYILEFIKNKVLKKEEKTKNTQKV